MDKKKPMTAAVKTIAIGVVIFVVGIIIANSGGKGFSFNPVMIVGLGIYVFGIIRVLFALASRFDRSLNEPDNNNEISNDSDGINKA